MVLARQESLPLAQDRLPYRWVMLAVGVLSQLGASFPGQGIPALGYFLQREWSLSRAEVGLFVSALYFGGVLSGAVFGVVADVAGVRWLLLLGQLLIAGCVVLLAFSNSFLIALLVLLPVGVGSAMVNPAISKVLMFWFPPLLRGTAMGIKQAAVPLSGALVSATLPALAIAFHWRLSVVVLALVVAACAVLSWVLYRESPYTAKLESASLRPSFREMCRAFARRDVVAASLLQIPLLATHFAGIAYLLLYFNEVLLFPVLAAAMLLAVAQFSGIAGRVLWGVASDRLFGGSRRNTLIVLAVLDALLLVAISALPGDTPLWLVVVLAALLGMVAFGWQGVFIAQVGEMAAPNLVATFYGVFFSIGQLGTAFGPPVFGYIVDRTGSYRTAWLVFAACLAVSAALLLTLRERYRGTS